MRRRAFLAGTGAAALTACSDLGDSGDAPADPTAATTSSPIGASSETAPAVADTATDVANGPRAARWSPHRAEVGAPPFEVGVASGDPGRSAVTLWTRITGRPAAGVTVGWEVASSPDFAQPIARGVASARQDDNHTLRVRATGRPAGALYYRCEVDGIHSPGGRTRTTAAAHDAPLRVALFSCQHYEEGWFVAHRAAVEDAPDLVIHVGDYIYGRWGSGTTVRTQPLADPRDLADYRALYDTYRRDPDLQRLHASSPFVAVWDDNEIRSNHAGTVPDPRDAPARRAWWEYQPTAVPAITEGGLLPIHRVIEFDRARIWLLDGRQYRSAQVCENLDELPGVDRCDAVDDEDRSMLGVEQEAWLAGGVADDGAWDVVAQGTVVADLAVSLGGLTGINNDQWDGYAAARRRLVRTLAQSPRSIALSGDIHAAMVNVIAGDDGETIPEFVTPGATSRMDRSLAAGLRLALGLRSTIRFFEPEVQGYVLLDIEPDQVVATLRTVDPLDSSSGAQTAGQWVVAPDARRPQRL